MRDRIKSQSQLINEISYLKQIKKKLEKDISQLKKKDIKGSTEKEFQEEIKKRFKTIFKNAQPITYRINKKGVFTLSEGKMLKSLGLSSGQVVGLSVYDIYNDYPILLKGVKTALRGKTFKNTLRIDGPKGDLYFDFFMSPDLNLKGEIIGLVGMAVDITERILAQNALKENENRLKEIQKISKVGGWEYDVESKEITWTEEVYRIHEISHETRRNLLNLSLKCYPPDARKVIETAFYKAVEKGIPYDHEAPFVSDKGTQKWIRTIGRAVVKKGKPLKVIGNIVDITERKLAEQVVKNSEVKFKTLANFLPLAMCILREDKILYVNPAWKKLTGYTNKDAETLHPLTLVHPDMKQTVANRAMDRIKGKEVPNRYELKAITKKGEIKWFDFSASTIEFDNQTAILTVSLDITEKKNANFELQKAELKYRELSEELLQNNKLKDLLFDIITHDLRNPAGLVGSYTDMLLKEEPENEILKGISKANDRLVKLLEEAALLVQVTSGEDINKKKLDAKQLINESLDEFTTSLRKNKIKLVLNCKRTFTIKANPIIREAIKNLISNAIRYAPRGEKIVIEAFKKNNVANFKVKDLGQTIPRNNREVIFERGIQLKIGKKSGHGLGLAITKRIVESHFGKVWVEPNKPRGNTFCIQIPIDNS